MFTSFPVDIVLVQFVSASTKSCLVHVLSYKLGFSVCVRVQFVSCLVSSPVLTVNFVRIQSCAVANQFRVYCYGFIFKSRPVVCVRDNFVIHSRGFEFNLFPVVCARVNSVNIRAVLCSNRFHCRVRSCRFRIYSGGFLFS